MAEQLSDNKEADLFKEVSDLLSKKHPVEYRWTHSSKIYFHSGEEFLSLRTIEYIKHYVQADPGSTDRSNVSIVGWHIWHPDQSIWGTSKSWSPNNFYLLTLDQKTRYLLETTGYGHPLNILGDKLASGEISEFAQSDVFGLEGVDKEETEFKDTEKQRELLSRLKLEIPLYVPLKTAQKAYRLIVQSRIEPAIVLEEACQGMPEYATSVLRKFHKLYCEIVSGDELNSDKNSGRLRAWNELLEEWGCVEQLELIKQNIHENYLEW